ncbi:hypothetical protein B296_00034357 [Ensete ventricosum]|uniref:Aminotransferase class I/classII large domain-containing protein n=1 Tax=Ensete ventricosum TaxID=4639 RepID=A0A426Y9K4_ENSVE|nr:hypothetical protein B296_00034357 [Ensete ventricosum]
MAPKPLDYESLNENVKKVAYAVRGELYLRASELQKEGKKVLFSSASPSLILRHQGLGCTLLIVLLLKIKFRKESIYILLQVVALCQAPFLLDDPNVELLFPADAIDRAKHYLSLTSGGLGTLLILVPVPQYPLYSATISLYGGSLVPYYLEEEANWGLDINHIHQSVAAARMKGICVS